MLGHAKLQSTPTFRSFVPVSYTLNPTGQRCCYQCDFIMADPPYLNPDAVKKFATTIRLLARDPAGAPETQPAPEPESNPDSEQKPVPVPVLYLSGAVTREWVAAELALRPCSFTPTFASKLSNEFYCYTNYASTKLGPFQPE